MWLAVCIKFLFYCKAFGFPNLQRVKYDMEITAIEKGKQQREDYIQFWGFPFDDWTSPHKKETLREA